MRSGTRDQAIDLARGMAMILVVWGHALVGASAASGASIPGRFALIMIYTTHMALFFWVAGLLSSGMVRRPRADFLRLMATRIVWPYLLWSVALLSLHFAMSDYTNTAIRHLNLATILWRPPAVMWFLYVLGIGLVLRRLLARFDRILTVLVGTAVFVAGYLVDPAWLNLRFVGLFLIASTIERRHLDTVLRPWPLIVCAAVMAATAAVAWSAAQQELVGYPAGSPAYIPALAAGPALLLALARGLSAGSGQLQTLLTRIGRNTMPIFVTHVPIVAGIRIAMRLAGIDNWPIVVLTATLLGLGLPLVAAALADRSRLSPALGWR